MLYSNNYLTKELKQKYTDTKISLRYLRFYGIFLGLFTFSLHFVLQTLNDSIISTRFPQFMSLSFHTVLYTYEYVSLIFFAFYFIINYQHLTFYEIQCNRWYVLKKLGYKGIWMVLSKLGVVLFSILTIYTIGFNTCVLLTVFLKYTFILNYLITMYIAGCITILLASVLILLGSLIIIEKDTPKYFILLVGLLLYLMQLATNYIPVVRNRVLMQDVRNLLQWETTPYVILCLWMILLGLVLCIVIALRSSSRFHIESTGIKHLYRWRRSLDIILYSCLTIFVVICAIIQLFILSITFASPAREVSRGGNIPYVFQSSTMEDAIKKNDLVYFQRIDVQAPLAVGDIVLFKEEKQIFVERIVSIHEDYITVDIDQYPEDSKEGIMLKSISRSSIYGIYKSSNSYLGALILFANSTFGRMLLLVLPSILIFFNQQIGRRIRIFTHQEESGGFE